MPGPAITYIAPPVEYTDALASWPARIAQAPSEGPRVIEGGIAWGTNGGGGAVHFNAGSGVQNPLSQIAAIWCDNLLSNTDVQFIFIDTGHVVTVPGQSSGLYPVNTQRTELVINCRTAPLPTDITRFSVFNFAPPPVAVAETNFVTASTTANRPIAAGAVQLIAPGQNGVVGCIDIAVTQVKGGASGSLALFLIEDGMGTTLGEAVMGVDSNETLPFATILHLEVNQRFQNGVSLLMASGGLSAFAAGSVTVNLFPRI